MNCSDILTSKQKRLQQNMIFRAEENFTDITCSSYSVMPQYYDDIQGWSVSYFGNIYDQLLKDIKSRITSLCDLCCGSGSHAIRFAEQGLKVYAVDKQPTFCEITRKKAESIKKTVQVIQADMREFQLPEKVDLVTCMFDSLNFLKNKCNVGKVFQSVCDSLLPGGYFAFDINTEKALREVWPKFLFLHEGDGWFCVCRGKPFDKTRRVGAMECLWFFLHDQGLWDRQTEFFEEISWTDQEILDYLDKAGFDLVSYWDGVQFGSKEEGVRIFYLAQKMS